MNLIKYSILLLMAILTMSSVFAVCPSGMVSYWKMDSSSAMTELTSSEVSLWNGLQGLYHLNGNANDAKGTSHGSVSGATVVAGKYGNGYNFDGSNDYIDFGNRFNYGIMSISFWAKFDTTGGYRAVVTKRGCCSDSTDFQWSFQTNNNNKMGFGIRTSAATYFTYGPTLDTNWHHYVGTYDGQTIKLYKDGAFYSQNTAPSGNILIQDEPIRFGSRYGGDYFDGRIDEVGIWNRVLSPAEVSALYYRLRTSDSEGGIYANIYGAASTTGKLNGALNFDGSSSYLTIPDNDAFSFIDGAGNDEPFSISAWVYADTLQSSDAGNWIIGKRGAGAGGNEWNLLAWEGLLYFQAYSDNSNSISANTLPINTGEWYHVVGTYDGSKSNSGLKIYLNGVDQTAGYNFTSGTYTGMSNGDQDVVLGKIGWGDAHFWDGRIDEVAIYNTELSSLDVANLYDASFSGYDYCTDVEPDIVELDYVNYEGNIFNATNLTIVDESSQVVWKTSVNVATANISKNVKLGPGFISLNMAELDDSFNTSADVTLTVDGCENLQVYYSPSGFFSTLDDMKLDGNTIPVACDGTYCQDLSCSGTTLSFNAVHFDGFGGEGDPPVGGVPEFSAIGIILIMLVAGIGTFIIRKKYK